jgi:hypothetical protein
MFELLALMVLVPVGLAIAAVVLVVGGLLHLVGRVLLLPFALLGGLLKLALLVPLVLIGVLVVGPVLLGMGMVLLLPLLVLGCLVWGVARLAAA